MPRSRSRLAAISALTAGTSLALLGLFTLNPADSPTLGIVLTIALFLGLLGLGVQFLIDALYPEQPQPEDWITTLNDRSLHNMIIMTQRGLSEIRNKVGTHYVREDEIVSLLDRLEAEQQRRHDRFDRRQLPR